jgi:hypothetical protein
MKLEVTGFEGAFDKIGKLKEELKPVPDSPLYRYLFTVATQIVSQLKESARQQMGGGTILEQSIGQGPEPLVQVEGNDVKITITANEYWKFVNDGVNGVLSNVGSPHSFRTLFPNRKMAESLQRGMSMKGLSLPQGFKDYESYSYASAVKLKKEGIKPNHFVDNVLTPEFLQFITKELSNELGKIVSLAIQE